MKRGPKSLQIVFTGNNLTHFHAGFRIKLSIYPCGGADPSKNLTISCPDKETQFKTTLSDEGLKKFKANILEFYKKHVLEKK